MSKNILLWIVIVVVMLAISSRYMPKTGTVAPHQNPSHTELADQNCIATAIGRITCPPPSGAIARDGTGQAVCGRGQCLKDSGEEWMCSTEVGGHVDRDAAGRAVCTGGCEAASANLCEVPR